MGYTSEQLLNIARAELGYCEKSSTNYDLDNKTAGAGSNNITKYARDLYKAGYYQASKQGCEWCDMFVDWCFLQLCGNKKDAEAMIYQIGVYGAACPFSANFYKTNGRYYTSNPKAGDQIFFGYSSLDHTGLIEKVENGYIYTIEGNADNQVKRRTYKANDSWIRGFGRPNYDENGEDVTPPVDPSEPDNEIPSVKEWKKAAAEDGFSFSSMDNTWDSECEEVARKAIVANRDTYMYKNLTRIVQRVVGVDVDGLCGYNTERGIINFQRDNGLVADGMCGLNTWKKMLNVDGTPAPVKPAPTPTPTPTPVGEVSVLNWKSAAIADGFKFSSNSNDNVWTSECEEVASNAIIRKRVGYYYKNLTKIVQKVVGVDVDGLCGGDTDGAIRTYQTKNGLTADGQVGLNTWKKMLGV